MNEINEIIRRYWAAEIERSEAEALLIDTCKREDMADWIMEAFCRMWVSPFNLGFQTRAMTQQDKERACESIEGYLLVQASTANEEQFVQAKNELISNLRLSVLYAQMTSFHEFQYHFKHHVGTIKP